MKRTPGNYASLLAAMLALPILAGCPEVGTGGNGNDNGAGNTNDNTNDNGTGNANDNGTGNDNANDNGTTPPPQDFTDASSAKGGSLYDNWWVVAGLDAPTADHALWANQTTNTRSGSDTWRCKECHGWDYKGVEGAYASGSHMTGFAGIFGTTKTPTEIFDLLHNDHGFGDGGVDLGDANIWDLTKFVLEGQIDTDDIIDANTAFIGDEGKGQTLYDGGIGGGLACAICHGADGLTIEFDEGEFLGTLASDNPWEFQHKVRFGQPGVLMPAAVDVDAANADIADLGAYAQTLPVSKVQP